MSAPSSGVSAATGVSAADIAALLDKHARELDELRRRQREELNALLSQLPEPLPLEGPALVPEYTSPACSSDVVAMSVQSTSRQLQQCSAPSTNPSTFTDAPIEHRKRAETQRPLLHTTPNNLAESNEPQPNRKRSISPQSVSSHRAQKQQKREAARDHRFKDRKMAEATSALDLNKSQDVAPDSNPFRRPLISNSKIEPQPLSTASGVSTNLSPATTKKSRRSVASGSKTEPKAMSAASSAFTNLTPTSTKAPRQPAPSGPRIEAKPLSKQIVTSDESVTYEKPAWGWKLQVKGKTPEEIIASKWIYRGNEKQYQDDLEAARRKYDPQPESPPRPREPTPEPEAPEPSLLEQTRRRLRSPIIFNDNLNLKFISTRNHCWQSKDDTNIQLRWDADTFTFVPNDELMATYEELNIMYPEIWVLYYSIKAGMVVVSREDGIGPNDFENKEDWVIMAPGDSRRAYLKFANYLECKRFVYFYQKKFPNIHRISMVPGEICIKFYDENPFWRNRVGFYNRNRGDNDIVVD